MPGQGTLNTNTPTHLQLLSLRSSSSDPADVTVFRLIGLTGLCDAGSPERFVRQGVKNWTGVNGTAMWLQLVCLDGRASSL